MREHRTDLWQRDQRPRDEFYRTLLREDPIRTIVIDRSGDEFRRIVALQMVKDAAAFVAMACFMIGAVLIAYGLGDWRW